MARTMDAWKATPEQVKKFMDETALAPVVFVDQVASEIVAALPDHPQANALWESLRGDSVVDYVCGRAALVFANNNNFRKAMLARDPRPQFRAFVRHWLAGVVREQFPRIFRDLPPDFCVGKPLAAAGERSTG